MKTQVWTLKAAYRQIARHYGNQIHDVLEVNVDSEGVHVVFNDGEDLWNWVENPDPARRNEAPYVWQIVPPEPEDANTETANDLEPAPR
jgi:hypothetical protein